MLSENARMATAAEARYRIDAPNSKQKRVKVIALDRPSEAIVKDLARKAWHGATFFTASSFASVPTTGNFSMQGWLSDLAGRTKNLVDEVDSADLVVMVATAGENAQAAALIGEACSLKRITTTGLILGAPSGERRDAVEDAGAAAPMVADARHRERRRLHRGHADRAARLSGPRVPSACGAAARLSATSRLRRACRWPGLRR